MLLTGGCYYQNCTSCTLPPHIDLNHNLQQTPPNASSTTPIKTLSARRTFLRSMFQRNLRRRSACGLAYVCMLVRMHGELVVGKKNCCGELASWRAVELASGLN